MAVVIAGNKNVAEVGFIKAIGRFPYERNGYFPKGSTIGKNAGAHLSYSRMNVKRYGCLATCFRIIKNIFNWIGGALIGDVFRHYYAIHRIVLYTCYSGRILT